MPQMDGVSATAGIKLKSPQTRIMILTSFGEDDKVIPAIQAGAQGYLLKTIQPEELIQALRETYQGKIKLHPDIVQKLLSFVAGNSSKEERSSPAQTDKKT
jgi:DNA-binding NarL/FixJ family response regulator